MASIRTFKSDPVTPATQVDGAAARRSQRASQRHAGRRQDLPGDGMTGRRLPLAGVGDESPDQILIGGPRLDLLREDAPVLHVLGKASGNLANRDAVAHLI